MYYIASWKLFKMAPRMTFAKVVLNGHSRSVACQRLVHKLIMQFWVLNTLALQFIAGWIYKSICEPKQPTRVFHRWPHGPWCWKLVPSQFEPDTHNEDVIINWRDGYTYLSQPDKSGSFCGKHKCNNWSIWQVPFEDYRNLWIAIRDEWQRKRDN